MEQLLNLVWLCAAVGIVFAVAARPRCARPRHAPYVSIAIFACVALLLFPVISASDDLHAVCALSDDVSWRHDKRSLGLQVLTVFIFVPLAPLILRRASQPDDVSTITPSVLPAHLRLDEGRAPPACF